MIDLDPADRDVLESTERTLDAAIRDRAAVPNVGVRGVNVFRGLHESAVGGAAGVQRGGADGFRVSRLLSGIVDVFVRGAFRMHFPGDDRRHPAVIALAGYGRGELSPFSDIDLLFLSDDPAGDDDPRVSAFLRFLWDLNLDLGHSTRTPGECIRTAGEDSFFATSLLESRFVSGRAGLDDDLRRRYGEFLAGGEWKTIALRKIEERRLRIESFNGTVQIQTPNLKESPGGLRDGHLVRWLAALSGGEGGFMGAERAGYLAPGEGMVIEGSYGFLLRLRNALHFAAGKKTDVLNHVVIQDAALRLGYEGEGPRPGERLMRDYYMHAGNVFRLAGRACGRFLDRIEARKTKPYAVLPIGIRTNDRDVALLREDGEFLESHPSLFVELFTVAGACGLSIAVESASAVERSLPRLGGEFPLDPDVRAAFHALLDLRTGISRALRLLHEHGVLARLIPEFGGVAWHYQHDFYHAYTTDEHSIRVTEHLEDMAAGRFAPFPQMHEVMADVTAKGALYLAGLLHDIGKAEGGAHSTHGERLAARALSRIDCDDRTTDLVRFLIREHLLMSHVTQRRDMDDPETIRDFIGKVRSAGRLRMLTALTFADLSALSEGVLSDWKKSLLWSLYTRALLIIERGYEETAAPRRIATVERAVHRLGDRVPEPTLIGHLNGLPEQYPQVTTPSSILAHLRGIARMEKRGAWASFARRNGLTFLTVICRDHPRVLSDICGVITSSDINILAAQIFTRRDGVVIDTFLVVDGDGCTAIPPDSQRTFKRNLPLVASGKASAEDLIRSHILRWRRRKRRAVHQPPRVRIDNSISSAYTVIDVFATDYTGLLYDVTSVLAEFGMDIHTARIGTDEDQVADAFYIRKSGGGKVTGEEEMEELRRGIIGRLESAQPLAEEGCIV